MVDSKVKFPQLALWRALGAAALSVGIAGTAPAAQEPAAAHPSRPAGVAWFEGPVADAFSAAAESHKPVFLYWGAVWCPPCQELKATIFHQPEFLERLALFVPVYLDGDDPGAQAWGEKFHISGYPTVLVLRADQAELERVSGGMELSRYAEVLDLALGQARPARELLDGLAGTTGTLAAPDCRQLAYNDWRNDDAWMSHPESLGPLADALAKAAARCAPGLRIERARLQLTAAEAAVLADRKAIEAGKAPADRLKVHLEALDAVLADAALATSVGDMLETLPPEAFQAYVQLAPKQRAVLQQRYFAVMDALAADARYSRADHIYALYGKVSAAKALDPKGKVAPALSKAAVSRIEQALAQEHDPYTRTSLINAALNVYEVLGEDDRAHAILAAESASSPYAYYYMSDLAELEEKRGHADVALQWLERSYTTAQGPATRFQWGVGYVRGILRMHPQDDAAVRGASLAILGDLEAAPDLHGRTRRGLARLDTALRTWNKDGAHAETIGVLRERMQGVCGKLAPEDTAREACGRFLAPAG